MISQDERIGGNRRKTGRYRRTTYDPRARRLRRRECWPDKDCRPLMALDPAARARMLAAVPRLRAFALSLCRNPDGADDLVQETLVRACDNIESFRPGSNMNAWLTTILRNHFYSEYRRRAREVEDADGAQAATLMTLPDQIAALEYQELRGALARLPDEMREVLYLVFASGLSCRQAAEICGCAVGTIKSRVHRARAMLIKMLSLESPADLFQDPIPQSVAVAAEQRRFHHPA
jgi:RNA polymerase sigma-70 factor, ECF subfamily